MGMGYGWTSFTYNAPTAVLGHPKGHGHSQKICKEGIASSFPSLPKFPSYSFPFYPVSLPSLPYS